ncbi:hypothetical protein B0T18DRAFT_155958 [Schizothecium vesticola]|uniref:Uncharacterized protein n=1 Tax=Schizothecium vesticola TaxID=314040 RepID=A0AA40EWE1_9PEZI|nr:hypothetical protein B0T18DRAFT_155958 [Schizothecium vesticola]
MVTAVWATTGYFAPLRSVRTVAVCRRWASHYSTPGPANRGTNHPRSTPTDGRWTSVQPTPVTLTPIQATHPHQWFTSPWPGARLLTSSYRGGLIEVPSRCANSRSWRPHPSFSIEESRSMQDRPALPCRLQCHLIVTKIFSRPLLPFRLNLSSQKRPCSG